MEEKRELVYEISEWSQGAPELLQSWSRNDILQILSTESGKERKFTGLTKLKIIEILLKVVADKKSHEKTTKRQKKSEISSNTSSINNVSCDLGSNDIKICKNSACRAKLNKEDGFCKRCSCCICHQFDDNKDPSLWLTCNSEYPYEGMSCGLSCHLECALQHERSGIGKDRSFYCVSCGKVNDLLQCWRKQMIIARDTRSINILCFRVSLSQKLLGGTKNYENLHKIANEMIQKLEADVGPLTGVPVKQARGVVNRLASGPEVQRLCALAVKTLDSLLSNKNNLLAKDDEEVKISQSQSLVTNSSSLSNPSSVEDENNNIVGYKDTKESDTDKHNKQEKIVHDDVSNDLENVKEFDPFVHITEVELPITPCKPEKSKPEPSKDNLDNNLDDGCCKEQDGSSSKKRSVEEGENRDFGYYVKVIRWLECKQHIDKDFRQKFLTWYSLKATPQEVRVVKVFVDTLMEDPALLAGQLVDTFSEVITSKKCAKGLCLKLFH